MQRRLLVAIALALCGCTTATPPSDAVNPFLQIAEPVASGVTVLRQAQPNYAGVVGNVTIIEQAQGVVLVDSGSSYGDGARVADAVRRVTRKPVTAVVITHWHNDHPLGLA
ncbi:MAG TPA: MBL fold metallo-hydrolase, partial [Vitreimonas sp.]|nr:MBL fold metallo-hydrolase [Vitreimonas sp.]